MREYLFRGKRVDNGEWIEGVYYKQLEYYGDTVERDCIITSKEVLSYDQALCWEEVIPETVGQYTGMTDKNGKKIFEGDIVICFERKFACEWNKVSCQFTLKNLDENFGFNYFCSAEVEVIGSLHDTELLGGDKE